MLGAHDEPGIMAQALNDLFLEMDRTSQDMSYKVTMSYLEVYAQRKYVKPTQTLFHNLQVMKLFTATDIFLPYQDIYA